MAPKDAPMLNNTGEATAHIPQTFAVVKVIRHTKIKVITGRICGVSMGWVSFIIKSVNPRTSVICWKHTAATISFVYHAYTIYYLIVS